MLRLKEEIEDPANEDKFMMDDIVSALEIKHSFTTYRASLRRFQVSTEEFFELLQKRNGKLEQVDSDDSEEEKKEEEEVKHDCGTQYFEMMPVELKILILKFAGPKGFYNLLKVSTSWHRFLQISQESPLKTKALKNLFKNYSVQLWPTPLYRTNRSYLNKFNNWRDMLRLRPLIRYDGVYRCKMR